MLTSRQKNVVQGSFMLLGSVHDVTALFYTRLFELDPMLRPLFASDLAGQRRKLGYMLTWSAVYAFLCNTMQEGMRGPRDPGI
jgi:hemoglobin-like flavoprotein